jgi:hypothetical protein
MKKQSKMLRISGWIRLFLAVACFVLAVVLDIAWLPWRILLLIAALVLLYKASNSVEYNILLKDLTYTILEGEASVSKIASLLKRKEKEIRVELEEMIKLGILPNAAIIQDEIVSKDIVETNLPKAPSHKSKGRIFDV